MITHVLCFNLNCTNAFHSSLSCTFNVRHHCILFLFFIYHILLQESTDLCQRNWLLYLHILLSSTCFISNFHAFFILLFSSSITSPAFIICFIIPFYSCILYLLSSAVNYLKMIFLWRLNRSCSQGQLMHSGIC